ncbi:hypothetical protein E2C01_037982 [Portunus trituberculatus]|uniref:Uncharacterized protein n=1 Tax=Portunus trituberculatus TaxID=210409 RepID=A0A5B7FAZ7_PORTR|nr:hypothetical protein [Portunus trituberculatus]
MAACPITVTHCVHIINKRQQTTLLYFSIHVLSTICFTENFPVSLCEHVESRSQGMVLRMLSHRPQSMELNVKSAIFSYTSSSVAGDWGGGQ